MLDVVGELFQQGIELHKLEKFEVASQLDTAVLKEHRKHPTASFPAGYPEVNTSLRIKYKSTLDKITAIDPSETESKVKVYVSDTYAI
jgi:hypothetical protein